MRCRLGLHAWVRRHPPNERYKGPDNQVCRLCGKQRGDQDLPPIVFTGGG
jgi:hypothetical protein